MILVLDNRDSFTFNLAQALETLGQRVEVLPARGTDLERLRRRRPSHLVLGPGPGRPEDARLCLEAILALAPELPTLGVCLGHQAIAVALGARVGPCPRPMHGRTVRVEHDGVGAFRGLPSPLECMRYNSLAVEEGSLPACLAVSARSAQGDLMGLRHASWPLEGLQFHPESVLSQAGLELLANFVAR